MVVSFLAGLPAHSESVIKPAIAFIAVSLLINSKQALTLWMRSAGRGLSRPLVVFFSQSVLASLLLARLLAGAISGFLPYAAAPFAYIFFLRFAGEHMLITEISGFVLLTMSALLSSFVSSGNLDPALYISVAVFFTAGVFKVRIQFKKRLFYRALMLLYIVFAGFTYYLIKTPLVMLLPLMDNLVFAITLYRVKLQTTGWIEALKGIIFLVLMRFYY